MRLVDADELPNELFKKHVHDCEELEPMMYFEDAVKVVENAPTIDAIPVEWLRKWQDEVGTINEWWPIIERIITVWREEQEVKQ